MTASTKLAPVFEKAAHPPLVDAKTYAHLLQALLARGTGYGKTTPVAAYYLTPLKLVQRTDSSPEGIEQDFEFKPLYLIMDPKKIPTEYGRLAMFEGIMLNYARRMIGERDLNHPDYKGPEIWTAKKAAFEFDYTRRAGLNEQDRPINIYDPNPDAFRVCMQIDERMTLPTEWGENWEAEPGDTLAIRERDVPALAKALRKIEKNKCSAEDALLTQTKNGVAAKIDVYMMSKGFLSDNYNPVALKAGTRRIARNMEKSMETIPAGLSVPIPAGGNVLQFASRKK